MGEVKIVNQYFDKINWKNGKVCPYQINNTIDVWKINVSSNLHVIDPFLAVMAADEIERANRYLRIEDKNRSILSRGALRVILGNYLNKAPSSLLFEAGINQKPRVAKNGNTGLAFNLSHSGDWILIAVANSEIGADVEFINPKFQFQDILTDYFVEEEVKFIQQNVSTERFFRLWTRKEALAKATGKGLDSPLKYFPGLDGIHLSSSEILCFTEEWAINSFNINEAYVASVAGNPLVNDIQFWDFGFNRLSF